MAITTKKRNINNVDLSNNEILLMKKLIVENPVQFKFNKPDSTQSKNITEIIGKHHHHILFEISSNWHILIDKKISFLCSPASLFFKPSNRKGLLKISVKSYNLLFITSRKKEILNSLNMYLSFAYFIEDIIFQNK